MTMMASSALDRQQQIRSHFCAIIVASGNRHIYTCRPPSRQSGQSALHSANGPLEPVLT
jgi:hypothetical protein